MGDNYFFNFQITKRSMKFTAEGFCRSSKADIFFAKAKVGDFNMSVLIKQQVFQLQIPIDDVVRVQISEKTCDSSDVDLCDISVVVAEKNLLKARRETTRRK